MSDVTTVKGREVMLKRPPMVLFGMFSDLGALVQNVPEEYGGKITADRDSVRIEYKGISLGFVVARREPFSLVVLKDDGKSFLNFQFLSTWNLWGWIPPCFISNWRQSSTS